MTLVVTCMQCMFAFPATVNRDKYVCPSCGAVMVRKSESEFLSTGHSFNYVPVRNSCGCKKFKEA